MRAQGSGEEILHQDRYFVTFVFQREMAGVEQVQLRVGQVLEIGLGAWRREDHVVPTPDDERRRASLAEEPLELRIQIYVGAVVIEEIELYVHVSRPVEMRLIMFPGRRIHA